MKLPNSEIGVSDLLQWRSCPARFALGMQRHGPEGELPGMTNENNAYGTAVHDAIHLRHEGMSASDAVTEVWPNYAKWLDPEDLAQLEEDLARWAGDPPSGFELVGSEMEGRVPLFVHEGERIYFRFRLDVLYRRRDDPTVFLHRDYKSSKWRKTQAEVDRDIQLWAYNWAIYELFPECSTLLQSYDQLRFGSNPTSKNEQQRTQVKAWLIETVRAVLGDDELAPKQEPFCAFCPLVTTCSETVRAVDTWKARLALIAPRKQEGRKLVLDFWEDEAEMETMVREVLPRLIEARKHLEAVEHALKGDIERMPSERRAELGWRLSDRRTKVLPPEGLRALHEALGDGFYEVAGVSRTALEALIGKPRSGEPLPPALKVVKDLELERVTSTTVLPA